jgi:hypothetical protein
LPNHESDYVIGLHPEHANPEFQIAPGQTTILPVRISLTKRTRDSECESKKKKRKGKEKRKTKKRGKRERRKGRKERRG